MSYRSFGVAGLLAALWPSLAFAQGEPGAAAPAAPEANPPAGESAPKAEAPASTPAEASTETAQPTPPEAPAPTPPDAAPSEPAPSDTPAPTASADSAAGWGDLSSVAGSGDTPIFQTRLYGFINSSLEKSASTPVRDASGNTAWEESPYEWDVLNFNVMLQGSILGRYKYFFNLVANGAGPNTEDVAVDVRNAWVELPIINEYLNLRAGKTYRRFGLYNEILDAVPTFIGIEPPEIFDKDHLMLTRTTNFMLHGVAAFDLLALNYSLTTGADEKSGDNIPLGGDLNVQFGEWLKLGSSFYWSGKDAVPSRAVGDGSPKGGVINWMAKDEYAVFGGYAEARLKGLLVQAEYWQSPHKGERDPASVALLANANLNERQLAQFFDGGDPTGTVRTTANYVVETFYTRVGYEFLVGDTFTVTPYGQFDYFSNPETINEKDFGGDAEAGLADDGKFLKYTLGGVFRPVTQVAFKLDGSIHQQTFNGRTEIYPEVRSSLSYLWEL